MSKYKIEELITFIFMHYSNSEVQSDAEYELWCNSECDSVVTAFERLSNLGLIVVKSNLDERDVRVVMHLLNAIVTENYYIFEPEMIEVYPEDGIDKQSLLKYDCSKLWIKYLQIVLENIEIVKSNTIDIKPNNFERIVLNVYDINNGLRLTETGMVTIIK